MISYKYFGLGLTSVLIAFNGQAKTALPVENVALPLAFESSLSKFRSITNGLDKNLSSEPAVNNQVEKSNKPHKPEVAPVDPHQQHQM